MSTYVYAAKGYKPKRLKKSKNVFASVLEVGNSIVNKINSIVINHHKNKPQRSQILDSIYDIKHVISTLESTKAVSTRNISQTQISKKIIADFSNSVKSTISSIQKKYKESNPIKNSLLKIVSITKERPSFIVGKRSKTTKYQPKRLKKATTAKDIVLNIKCSSKEALRYLNITKDNTKAKTITNKFNISSFFSRMKNMITSKISSNVYQPKRVQSRFKPIYQAKRANNQTYIPEFVNRIINTARDISNNTIGYEPKRLLFEDGQVKTTSIMDSLTSTHKAKRVKSIFSLDDIKSKALYTSNKVLNSTTAGVAVCLVASIVVLIYSEAYAKTPIVEISEVRPSQYMDNIKINSTIALDKNNLLSSVVSYSPLTNTIENNNPDEDTTEDLLIDAATLQGATLGSTLAGIDNEIIKTSIDQAVDLVDEKRNPSEITAPPEKETVTPSPKENVEIITDNYEPTESEKISSVTPLSGEFYPSNFTKCPSDVSLDTILSIYGLSYDQYSTIAKIILCEAYAEGNGYEEVYSVTTTLLNRISCSRWIRSHGVSMYKHATAPGQYVVYEHGSYLKYDMNGINIVNVNGYSAIKDAMYGFIVNPDTRIHNYCSFRSNSVTSYSNNRITRYGNRYGGLMSSSEIQYPEFLQSEEAIALRNQALGIIPEQSIPETSYQAGQEITLYENTLTDGTNIITQDSIQNQEVTDLLVEDYKNSYVELVDEQGTTALPDLVPEDLATGETAAVVYPYLYKKLTLFKAS